MEKIFGPTNSKPSNNFHFPITYEAGKTYTDARGNKVTILRIYVNTLSNDVFIKIKYKMVDGATGTAEIRGVRDLLGAMARTQ